jgi:hypothetical protein
MRFEPSDQYCRFPLMKVGFQDLTPKIQDQKLVPKEKIQMQSNLLSMIKGQLYTLDKH